MVDVRKRAAILETFGICITHYIDLKDRTLKSGIPVIHHNNIPDPETCFVLSMVGNRGARGKIRRFLSQRGFEEGRNSLFAA